MVGTVNVGIGRAAIIHAVATQGSLLIPSYDLHQDRRRGLKSLRSLESLLTSSLSLELIRALHRTYINLNRHGSTSLFRWRKYPLGLSDANATSWTEGLAISVSSATLVDSGLSVKFQSASYTVSVSNRWTFTADRGHTFVLPGCWSGFMECRKSCNWTTSRTFFRYQCNFLISLVIRQVGCDIAYPSSFFL